MELKEILEYCEDEYPSFLLMERVVYEELYLGMSSMRDTPKWEGWVEVQIPSLC